MSFHARYTAIKAAVGEAITPSTSSSTESLLQAGVSKWQSLSWNEAAWLVVAVSLSFFTLDAIRVIYFHPLSRFPGPKWWALSRVPYVRSLVKGTFVRSLRSHHDRYGPIVRVATNELAFTHPDAWHDIYGHHGGDKNFPRNPIWYQDSVEGVHTIFSANNEDHARIRRLLAHAFSEKALKDQEWLIQGHIDQLMLRLSERADGTPINICDWFHFTTFDVIGDLAFGESFGCLENGDYHPWIKVILGNFNRLIYFGCAKMLPVVSRIAPRMVPKKVLKQRQDHYDFTKHKVGKRLDQGDDPSRPDFITYVCRFNDAKGMSRSEILSTFNTLATAGSETTASLLTALVHECLLNPRAYRKLVEEIRSSFSSESEITIIRTARLRYLNACIDEALRMCTPAPVMIPRLVPKGGARICGEWIPGGTAVEISPYAMFRSAANFSQPDTFIPERWLSARDKPAVGDQKLDNHVPKALKPFSNGPRSCLGNNLALMEVRVALSRLLFRFDIADMGKKYDWKDQLTYVVWIKEPLMVGLRERKKQV